MVKYNPMNMGCFPFSFREDPHTEDAITNSQNCNSCRQLEMLFWNNFMTENILYAKIMYPWPEKFPFAIKTHNLQFTLGHSFNFSPNISYPLKNVFSRKLIEWGFLLLGLFGLKTKNKTKPQKNPKN